MSADKAIDYIRDNALPFGNARAERIILENTLRTTKALLMKEAMVLGHGSVAAQEREAYANPMYIELINDLGKAVVEEERLRYQMKAAELRVEWERSKEATNRMVDRAHV